jgi:hypothetical protein
VHEAIELSANMAEPLSVLTRMIVADVTSRMSTFLFRFSAFTEPAVMRTTSPALMPAVKKLPVLRVMVQLLPEAATVSVRPVRADTATKSLRNAAAMKSA